MKNNTPRVPSFVPFNFGGLDEKHSSPESSSVVILPVPYDSTASYMAGSRNGPEAIISASRNMELFDQELGHSPYVVGIHTLPFLERVAASPDEMVESVSLVVGRELERGKYVVLLGGDHILTLGAVRALKGTHKSLGVVQFDAHADMRDSYEGTGMSHACTGRRLVEVTSLLQAGVRSISEEEHAFCRSSGIVSLSPSRMTDFAACLAALPEHVYVTVDVDALDPSIMPAVGTPEPGGLAWNQILDALREIARSKKVVGFDIVELCPIPGLVAPDFLVAKLVYKMLGYFFGRPAQSR
ncbi:MAG: agmatinase [Candidatus Eisenbacteria bacterium]